MATIQFENGQEVEFEGNPTPEDVDFVAKQLGIGVSSLTPLRSEASPLLSGPSAIGERIGEAAKEPIFDVPSAAIRSSLQGTGYQYGALNPEQVPSFQEQFLDKYYSKLPDFAGKELLGNFISAGGLVADVATNPADLLLLMSGKVPTKGGTLGGRLGASEFGQAVKQIANEDIAWNGIRKVFSPTPTQLAREAETLKQSGLKKVTELLNPSKTRLALFNERQQVLPEVEAGFNVIRKSKTAGELVSAFKQAKNENIDAVKSLIKNNNKEVGAQYLGRARLFIERAESEKLYSPRVISAMKQRLKREESFLRYGEGVEGGFVIPKGSVEKQVVPAKGTYEVGRIGSAPVKTERVFEKTRTESIQGPETPVKSKERVFTLEDAQRRKIDLQKQTEALLKAQTQGKSIVTKPGEDLIENEIRIGLKETIEREVPEIGQLNKQFEGLDKGLELSSTLQAEEQLVPSKFLQRITYALGRPSKESMAAAIVREIPFVKKPLSKVTSEIEKLRRLSSEKLLKSFLP